MNIYIYIYIYTRRWRRGLKPPLRSITWMLKPKPSELKPKPTELKPKPLELKPKPTELKPKPSELKPRPLELKPRPLELKPRPPELKPKPPELKPTPPELKSSRSSIGVSDFLDFVPRILAVGNASLPKAPSFPRTYINMYMCAVGDHLTLSVQIAFVADSRCNAQGP